MDKVEFYRKELNKSEEERVAMALAHKKELKRMQRFYEVVAFGLTRSGRMVRAAMGTTQVAKHVMEEMTVLFSTNNDCNY